MIVGTKKNVTILDYGLGNLLSVSRAIENCGAQPHITDKQDEIISSDYLILPGVGNFSIAAEELRKRGLEEMILKFLDKERPLLGICLGMQLLFDSSEEQGLHKGLGIISGSVKPIPNQNREGVSHKIPHIGWAPLTINRQESIHSNFLAGADLSEKYFYFIHSFQGHANNYAECLATTKYNEVEITAVAQKDYVIGAQFHPEKSGENGIRFLKTFLSQ